MRGERQERPPRTPSCDQPTTGSRQSGNFQLESIEPDRQGLERFHLAAQLGHLPVELRRATLEFARQSTGAVQYHIDRRTQSSP